MSVKVWKVRISTLAEQEARKLKQARGRWEGLRAAEDAWTDSPVPPLLYELGRRGAANPDRWAPSDSRTGAYWIRQELLSFPAPPRLQGSLFSQAPHYTPTTRPWPWRPPIGPRQPRDEGESESPFPECSPTCARRPRGAARCVIAGRWGAEIQPPTVLSRGLEEEASPSLVPGHRVLGLSLTPLTRFLGSSHLASSVSKAVF